MECKDFEPSIIQDDKEYKRKEYISINKVAEAKGLKSNRSIRLELNKPESKYIFREIKVNGGTSYEILFSSLEPELQNKLRAAETKTTALVPRNYIPNNVITDKARLFSDILKIYPYSSASFVRNVKSLSLF